MSLYESILVPVDFSEASIEGASRGLALARAFGAGVTLLHVIDIRYLSLAPSYLGEAAPLHDQRLRQTAEERLDHLVASLDTAGVEVSRVIEFGIPGDVILDRMETGEADLAVMGSRGRTGFQRAVLGSQAEYVIRRAGIPVLVVHAPPREKES